VEGEGESEGGGRDPGDAMLMHMQIVPLMRGAMLVRSFDGGVVACDRIAENARTTPGALHDGAKSRSALSFVGSSVTARASRTSVLCSAAAPARILGKLTSTSAD